MTLRTTRNWILWAAVAVLLASSGVLGSIASVASLIAGLALLPLVATHDAVTAVRKQPAMLCFLVVFLLLALCFVTTADSTNDPLYALNFLALAVAPAVYLSARWAGTRGAVLAVAILSLLGVTGAAAVSLLQTFGQGAARAYGLFGGGNLMPRIAIVLGFISIIGISEVRGRRRVLFYAGPILAVVAVFLSGSRGAALGVPAAALVAAFFIATDPTTRRPWLALTGLAGSGLLALVGLYWLSATIGTGGAVTIGGNRMSGVGQVIAEAVRSGVTGDTSTNLRLDMLTAAVRAFANAPLLGHGWGNLAAAASPYIDLTQSPYGGPTDPFFQFHNDLANFAVAAGIVGVICWVALLAAPVLGALMSPRDAMFRVRLYCCVQLSVIYFVLGLTDFTLGYDLPTTLYAFLTAIALGAFRESAPDAPAPTETTRPAT